MPLTPSQLANNFRRAALPLPATEVFASLTRGIERRYILSAKPWRYILRPFSLALAQESTMSAPPSTYEPNLSTREELAVSGAALSEAPWKLAGAAGVAAAGADFLIHLPFHLFHPEALILTPLSMGAVAFFAVAGAGALIRTRHSRALRWARRQAVALRRAAGRCLRDYRVRADRAGWQRRWRRRLHRAMAWRAGLRSDRRRRLDGPASAEPANLIPAPAIRLAIPPPGGSPCAYRATARQPGPGCRGQLSGPPAGRAARKRRAATGARPGRPAMIRAVRCSPSRAAVP